MNRSLLHSVGALAMFALISGCGENDDFPTASEISQLQGLAPQLEHARRPTNAWATSSDAAAFGQQLFNDSDLSSCGWAACASCHESQMGYAGSTSSGIGCHGRTLRQVPTLIGSASQSLLDWDGHKDSAWAQASQPLTAPGEMNASATSTRALLQERYQAPYHALFGVDPADEIDSSRLLANFGKAIEAYIGTLQWSPSSFDAALADFVSLAKQGRATESATFLGFKTFVRRGCVDCHSGPELSDRAFHTLGLFDAGEITAARQGLAEGASEVIVDSLNGAGAYSDDPAAGAALLASLSPGSAAWLGQFATPGLRGVAHRTGFMHNGGLATLDDVVSFFDRGGDPDGSFLGTRDARISPLNLSDDEHQALVQWLSLLDDTGEASP